MTQFPTGLLLAFRLTVAPLRRLSSRTSKSYSEMHPSKNKSDSETWDGYEQMYPFKFRRQNHSRRTVIAPRLLGHHETGLLLEKIWIQFLTSGETPCKDQCMSVGDELHRSRDEICSVELAGTCRLAEESCSVLGRFFMAPFQRILEISGYLPSQNDAGRSAYRQWWEGPCGADPSCQRRNGCRFLYPRH
ncbi:hypothetical protein HD554DRAFT_1072499 [Boletus coccyginus]|nr:hypothetical protein HD554DRAFT_1072499 [Boletus coccyginus]